MDPERITLSSRLLEACNTCRKRKVKCDRQRPTCTSCSKSHMDCSYTDKVKVLKAPRRRPTRAKQFADRLEKVERLLQYPVAVLERMAKETSMMSGSNHTAGSVSNGSETSMTDSNPVQQNIQGATQPTKNFEITSQAENGRGGEGPNMTPLGKRTLESDHSTNTTDTGGVVREVSCSNNRYSPQTFKELPPKDEAISLLQLFFARFNSVFPLLHQQTFMHMVQVRYSTKYDGDVGWWSNLNMALAHGSRIRNLYSQTALEDDEESWGYLENSIAVVPLLAVGTASLSSIQALLGIAVFLQATPVPRSYSLLVASAIRLGHSIGLHRQESYHTDMPITEVEQRKRVFWLCYILDKDISMRSGQPSVQHDDDIDVELPFDDLDGGVGYIFLTDGLWPVNFLQLRIQLAVIQGEIYRDLYSAKAKKQSDAQRAAVVQELDEKLRKWKDSTTIEFHPDYLTQRLLEPFDILHIVVLYFTYFNCLTLVNRPSFESMSWKTRVSSSIEPFNPRNFSSKQIVIEAARTALTVLRLIPLANYTFFWLTLQFACSAIITLLRNIHLNPTLPNAASDYNLVEPIFGMFCQLAYQHIASQMKGSSENGQQKVEKSGIIIELMRMRDFCYVLKGRAKSALEGAVLIANSSRASKGPLIDENWTNHGITPVQPSPLAANMFTDASLSNRKIGSEMASAQTFENLFDTDMAAANAFPPQRSTIPEVTYTALHNISPSIIEPEEQYTLPSPSHCPNSPNFEKSCDVSTADIMDRHPTEFQEVTAQESPGLWNWWDVIERDFEGINEAS